jgi:hypothetical protein
MQPRIIFDTEENRTRFEDSESVPPIEIFILYQDAASGRRAMEVYEPLILGLGSEFRFTQSMWKFDLLHMPKLAETASAEAARSDLVFFAVSDPHQVSDQVKNWLEEALPSGDYGPGGLVLIQTEGCPVDMSLHAWLKGLATQRQIEFFFNDGPPPPAPTGLEEEDGREGLSHRSAPPRYWGINE